MGLDNLVTLNQWHKWKELLIYCHLIVLPRTLHKKHIKNNILKAWVKNKTTRNYLLLHSNSNGYIFFSNTPYVNISSTKIRLLLKNNFSCPNLLPISVIHYIKKYNLYI
ncbi:nicotinate-nicotinamide nucleotide adenylyltransferase [Buchnera aphidicola]|uniref:nicotinate-nicotinamide nucleotide adenylyltransferase n=1 Tax=Buchnera aphidicola TaxID=9 RepID=UPI003967ADBF